ncbi:T9SS type A sorting domain-containing protein [bacterium]|nr:T9SS type A sorting domain-containing protein [bacterium]
MKKRIDLSALLLAAAVLFGMSNVYAANIYIVESQSYNPSHIQDSNWQTAAINAGHSATIVPQTTLDNTAYIANADLLIVSSGVIYLPPNRVANIQAMMQVGKPVYLQCEYPMTQSTTQAFDTIVDNLGGPWTYFDWIGEFTGSLTPMQVNGDLSFDPNFVSSLSVFNDGVYGEGGIGFSSDLYLTPPNRIYGFSFYPSGGIYGMMCCNTDQDWAIYDPNRLDFMENYFDRLFDYGGGGFIWLGIEPVNTSIPSSGGTLNYYAQVMNPTPNVWTGDAWTYVFLPNGNYYGPLMVNYGLSFQPDQATPVLTLSQYVPAVAPPGAYTFVGNLGTYPTNSEISRTFTFWKQTPGPDDRSGDLSEERITENWYPLAGQSAPARESDASPAMPDEFVVGDPYPNPFNPSTTIELSLPEARNLSVVVYDVQGREVETLAQGSFGAGAHRFSFDARGLASGIYFLRAQSGSEMQTRKLMLLH